MNFLAPLLYAVSAAVLSAIALGFAGGGLSAGSAHLSLGVGAAMAAWGFWQTRRSAFRWPQLGGWAWAVVVLFGLFALRMFLWVVFFSGDEIRVLSPNNLGDLSLHLTYIREFASGEPFWPDNPIYSGAKLTYPIGVDLFHALLVLAGADTFRTFAWLGLLGAGLTGVMLGRWGGAFTVTGFLGNGGLAGFLVLETGVLADYQADVAWKSIPLALFVTQRGFLFALPAGLMLLCSWRERFFPANGQPNPSRHLPWFGELLLYAALPVFHFHTFLFLSLLLAAWFVMEPARRAIALLVGSALIPATLLVLLITSFFHGPQVLGWMPGWMQDSDEFLDWGQKHLGADTAWLESAPWLARPFFWILNFGVLPFFIMALAEKIWRDREARRERAFLFPALGIFLLCCFVKFAPWPWDNTKIMIWSYLVLLPILWERGIRPWRMSARVMAGVALFGSGLLCLLGGLIHQDPVSSNPDVISQLGSVIGKRSELDAVARDLHGVSPRARFLAFPIWNHPLLMLGHKVALGYPGHIWSHGYPLAEPQARLTRLMNGDPDWRELARGFGARYLYWGSREMSGYPNSTQPWWNEARVVASGDWGVVYDLESPPVD